MASATAFRAGLDLLHGGMTRDLTRILAAGRGLTPTDLVASLLTTAPPVVAGYGDVGATLAADFYSELREEAGITVPYRVRPAAGPAAGQLSSWVRWGVAPAFADQVTAIPDHAWLALQQRLLGGGGRLLLQPARDTITQNAARDPVRVGYVRVPSPGACAWCLMLASRSALYTSAESAGDSDGYHDHCRCTVQPVFDGQDTPAINQALHKAWQAHKTLPPAELDQALRDAAAA